MAFPERIRQIRIEKGITQYEMAKALGISSRILQNYENGIKMPASLGLITKIAVFLGVSVDDIMGPEDHLLLAALESGGSSAEKELRQVMTELCALFSGGKLKECDREPVVNALNEIFWDSKIKAQEKYTPGGK